MPCLTLLVPCCSCSIAPPLPVSGACLQGWSKLRVQGLLQHHPDSSFMFLHRAGFHGRKYDPSQDQTRPVSHVVAQPTCEWNRLNKPFEEFVKLRQGRNTYTPQDCAYDLSSLQAAVAACGAERGRGQSRRAAKVPPEQPPIFEVRSGACATPGACQSRCEPSLPWQCIQRLIVGCVCCAGWAEHVAGAGTAQGRCCLQAAAQSQAAGQHAVLMPVHVTYLSFLRIIAAALLSGLCVLVNIHFMSVSTPPVGEMLHLTFASCLRCCFSNKKFADR